MIKSSQFSISDLRGVVAKDHVCIKWYTSTFRKTMNLNIKIQNKAIKKV